MITVLTDSAVGGTFLSWTIHYLSGHDRYFLQEKQQWQEITSNPLTTSNNAHSFVPNQPNRIFNCSPDQFTEFINHLDQAPTDTFHVLYFHNFDDANTTQKSLQYVNTRSNSLVLVDSSDNPLYHCSYRKRAPILIGRNTAVTGNQNIQDYFIEKYFKQSKQNWDEQNLHDIWDIREFLALNTRPLEVEHVCSAVDKTVNGYMIKAAELWTSFDFTIKNLFDYLKLSVDHSRRENWQRIYNQWRKIHHQRLMFSIYFDTIIHSILNNYTLDLLRFDLDIEQEAAIQHFLIYKHNLNFKTWQLEKFLDTKQLHSLLEPNTHTLN